MDQFYFVLTNLEAESLLKEEMRVRYPEFKLSYSRPGFITFKGGEQTIFNPLFCRVSGLSHGRFKVSELSLEKAWVFPINDKLIVPSRLQELSERTLFKVGETVSLLIMVQEDEFWLGTYTLRKDHFQTPGEVSSILETQAPSRAYYKMAEAFEAFDLPFEEDQRILELGSAPGGASQFLLEQGLLVTGVDPAEMNAEILKNKKFKHLKRPFETILENDFRDDMDWIVSDINLPPTVVLKEIYRMLTFLNPMGLIVTLKMNDLKHLEIVANVREQFRKRGFDRVELKYLPSHKKEMALIALRS